MELKVLRFVYYVCLCIAIISYVHTVDSLKFRNPNYSAPLNTLIAIYSKVRQENQIFKVKIAYFWQLAYAARMLQRL